MAEAREERQRAFAEALVAKRREFYFKFEGEEGGAGGSGGGGGVGAHEGGSVWRGARGGVDVRARGLRKSPVTPTARGVDRGERQGVGVGGAQVVCAVSRSGRPIEGGWLWVPWWMGGRSGVSVWSFGGGWSGEMAVERVMCASLLLFLLLLCRS